LISRLIIMCTPPTLIFFFLLLCFLLPPSLISLSAKTRVSQFMVTIRGGVGVEE
jgi:hypothetical protein